MEHSILNKASDKTEKLLLDGLAGKTERVNPEIVVCSLQCFMYFLMTL